VNNHGTVSVTAGGNPYFSYYPGYTIPTWNNHGTFTKSSGTGIFYFNSARLNNSGLLDIQSGTLSLATSCQFTNSATVAVGASAVLLNDTSSESTLLPDSVLTAAAANSVRITSGTVYVQTTNVFTPSLWINGGTLRQQAPNVVNTINQSAGTWWLSLPESVHTYNLTNGELRGANLVVDTFNWLGGSLNSDGVGSNTVTVASHLAISSGTTKNLSDYVGANGRRLINQGAGSWSGATISGYHGAQMINQGTLVLTSDAGLAYAGGTGVPVFHNQGGTFMKTNSSGISPFSSTVFTNSGSIHIAQGGINVGGLFVQTGGSARLGTNFTTSSAVRIEGGTLDGQGNMAATLFNNGSSSPGASPGLITGTSLTNTAAGVLRFEIGGTSAGTNYDQFRLSGPAILDGTADLSLANGFVPVPGNTFTGIVCSARSGTFSNLTFSGGYAFTVLYTPTTVVFRAENALPTASLLVEPTQHVCQPFPVAASGFDVGGVVTNITISLDGTLLTSTPGSSAATTIETDVPGTLTFVAQAIDDQGGTSYATQEVAVATYPLHVLSLGGIRETRSFKLCMLGQTGSNYMVQATTNLALPGTNWVDVGLMEYTNGIFRYLDGGTLTNRPARYYRAKQQ
jgi:hypothetical protein